MGGCNCKLSDSTDIATLNAIKGHFQDQWLMGDLHGNTIWKTALIILLLQLGAWGGYRVLLWYRKRKAARKAKAGKAAWENRATQNINYHNYQPSAPPITYGGRVTDFGGYNRFQEFDRARGQPLNADWGHQHAELTREEAALTGAAAAAAAMTARKKAVPFQNPLKGTGAMQEGQNTDDE